MPGRDQEADDATGGGPIVDEYYASSEAIGSTLITAEDWLAHPGSVGKPMMGALHILDEDGNELPPGEAGEIYFEGGFDFEYLNDPDKTAKSRDQHGWKTVGDIGYLDEEGYLYLTDRRHHMIISGGVNIYPQEAENMLVTHPKVMDAAVFGIPDDEMGQSGQGRRADGRSRRRHRRVRRRAAGLAAGPVGALQVSAVDLVRGAVAAHRYRQAVQAGADKQVLVTAVELAGVWSSPSDRLPDDATFTLTEERLRRPPRCHAYPSVPRMRCAELTERCQRWPQAAAVVRRRAALDRSRRTHPRRRHHRIAGVLDAAVGSRSSPRWLAERGPATVPDMPDPGAGRPRRRPPARPVQPAAAAQRVLHRHARGTARGARGRTSRPVDHPRWC